MRQSIRESLAQITLKLQIFQYVIGHFEASPVLYAPVSSIEIDGKNQQFSHYTHLRKLKWLYLQYYIVYYSIVFYEVLEGQEHKSLALSILALVMKSLARLDQWPSFLNFVPIVSQKDSLELIRSNVAQKQESISITNS